MCDYKQTITFKVVIIYESHWAASNDALHFVQPSILIYLDEERLHRNQTGGVVVFTEKQEVWTYSMAAVYLFKSI